MWCSKFFNKKRQGRKKKKVVVEKCKKQLKDYLTKEDVIGFIEIAKKIAKTDVAMLKFLLEHIFGKAPQNIKMSGDNDNPLVVQVYMPDKK